MTPRERLERIYQGGEPDRPAVRLWGLSPIAPASDSPYLPIHELAMRLTDRVFGSGSAFDMCFGAFAERYVTTEKRISADGEWEDTFTTMTLPGRKLRGIYRDGLRGRHGYIMEYPVKSADDLEALLRIPYEPFPFDPLGYQAADAAAGERGIALFEIDHAGYGLQRLMGSEALALFTLEARGLCLEALRVFQGRLIAHLKAMFASGLRPHIGWVGPELLAPPLLSPMDFDELVTAFDRELIDIAHSEGRRVWVHCHGKMRGMIGRFRDMGVDVLNPIEPPPMGDVSLDEAFSLAGGMALEGNIETHDIMTLTQDKLREKIRAALEVGARNGNRLILSPCSGYAEDVFPTRRYIENLRLFVEEGVAMAEALR